MALDEKLNAHVRAALADVDTVREVRMFGGIGFMLNGNMVAAASDRGLLVRVGKEGEAPALARLGGRTMVMNGRSMHGYIRVDPSGLDARTVKAWLKLARAYVETLAPKRKVKKASAERAVGAKAAAKGKATTKSAPAR